MEPILSGAIAGGAVGGLVVFTLRTWISERLKQSISHEYAQKLATFKAELEGQQAREMERFRADLRIAAAEHEIRFSRLHSKTAATIAGT